MGYRIIQINDNIAPIVHDFGIHYDYELLKPNFEYLNPNELTAQEKKILALADIIDKKVGEILNMRVARSNIRVFSAVRYRNGRRIKRMAWKYGTKKDR